MLNKNEISYTRINSKTSLAKRSEAMRLFQTSSRDSGSKEDEKPEQALYITCRSQSFTNTTIETATAVHLSRPEEAPTKIALGQHFHDKCALEGEGIDEKVAK
jgi:hypothetical protein